MLLQMLAQRLVGPDRRLLLRSSSSKRSRGWCRCRLGASPCHPAFGFAPGGLALALAFRAELPQNSSKHILSLAHKLAALAVVRDHTRRQIGAVVSPVAQEALRGAGGGCAGLQQRQELRRVQAVAVEQVERGPAGEALITRIHLRQHCERATQDKVAQLKP